MRILFCHNNYPAQFRRLAPALAAEGHDVVFLHKGAEWHATPPGGVKLVRYAPHRSSGAEWLHPYLRRFDSAVVEGQGAFRACLQLQEQGWIPDVIVSHAGYGNGLYLADAFPQARRFVLAEWYYNAEGSDVDFLRHGQVEPDRRLRLRTWNAHTLVEIAGCERIITPTHWQRCQFPAALQPQIEVVHEGIDWHRLSKLRCSPPPLPTPLVGLDRPEVLTYVSRGFEEYRGFPQVIQAIAALQRQRPRLHVLIAGSDIVAYGAGRSDGRSWRAWAEQEVPLDPARTHWLGALQEADYHALLAWSDVHLYLTVPFVLSWSLLEAMAAGCSIVASATPPVQEVLAHRRSALLVDFFSVEQQVLALAELLDDRVLAKALAAEAQRASSAYDAANGLVGWRTLLSVDAD
jgi:glycosyltransferase involved in cell wall biosynthesis